MNLEDRLKSLDDRLAARTADLDRRLSSRFGSAPGGASRPGEPPLQRGAAETRRNAEEENGGAGRPGGPPRRPFRRRTLFFALGGAALLVLVLVLSCALFSGGGRAGGGAPDASAADAQTEAVVREALSALTEEDAAALAAWADGDDEMQLVAALYFSPPASHLEELYEVVRGSDLVRFNPAFEPILGKVRFRYVPGESSVNAFASSADPVGGDETSPSMNLLGGFVRFARAVGLVVAAKNLPSEDGANRFDRLCEQFPKAFAAGEGSLSIRNAAVMVRECGVPPSVFRNGACLREAQNIADGMCLECLGHETGHLVYHHVGRTSDVSPETLRNFEREADSFAMSVGREERRYMNGHVERYMFLGSVYDNLLMALAEAAADGGAERAAYFRDHPDSAERLLNLLRSKSELAEFYGMTVADAEKLLRTAGAMK